MTREDEKPRDAAVGEPQGAAGSSRAPDGSTASRPVFTRTKLSLLAIGLLLAVMSPLWAPLLLRRSAFFRVRRVEILGARYVAPSDILAKLHVDTSVSVWNPTAPLAQRVASHPGIQRAVVRRKLPGTIVVEVVERAPVALVPTSSGLKAYDERGRSLPIDPTRVDAPVLAQRDTAALRLLGSLRARMPAFFNRVSSARATGKRELLLELKNIPVRTVLDMPLDRFAELEAVEADLARRQLHVAEIDLRYRDQVIARLP
jgi:cell division protein FtsQ